VTDDKIHRLNPDMPRSLVTGEPSIECITELEVLLAAAKRGEIRHICAAISLSGRRFQTISVGECPADRILGAVDILHAELVDIARGKGKPE